MGNRNASVIFFSLSFRFQSETVRLIIENMLVCASVFQCVCLGRSGGVGGERGEGWRLMANVPFHRFPKLLHSINIFQVICEWP